ncbi:hypothetical protein [Hymenobacter norwichensis]|uniref:hypothetical protein n=1 Tax=Hymenobacter norwichensis TaxID=223903 RepID=UPI0012F8FEAF|nr:hypothetical protein [Hymenobacter norwichensis]
MRIYLVAASTLLGVLACADVLAQAPHLDVEVVTPEHDKYAYLLDLSTSLDTADLTAPVCIPWLKPQERVAYSEAKPPRYDYRNARKVERRYNAARRYYRSKNRRDNRMLAKHAKERARKEKRLIQAGGKRQAPTTGK